MEVVVKLFRHLLPFIIVFGLGLGFHIKVALDSRLHLTPQEYRCAHILDRENPTWKKDYGWNYVKFQAQAKEFTPDGVLGLRAECR